MFEASGRFDLVDVLAAFAAAAIEFPFQIGRADLDLDTVVDQGVDEDRGKGRMPPGVGIEGRDTDEAMDPAFGFEKTIRERPVELEGGARV